ncbi:aldehyde ferredoxin oxidoreductase family protein [Chloroflexota bacterium]
MGKILVVDLTSAKVGEKKLQEGLRRSVIGGVGLGARLLYEYQSANLDPFDEKNVLGFMPGLLSGTIVPSASRLTVVSKSPLTRGWGDSNVGGYIASELKRAGYDGILFQGISPRPVYLLIYQGKAELRDASHLWGKDTIETEEILRKEIGDMKLRVACIGPAGEKLSLISAIITEGKEGRAAARSGIGAVMGSKLLKAIAVRGQNMVPAVDAARAQLLKRQFIRDVKETKVKFIDTLKSTGTAGTTNGFIIGGATPIRNWSLFGLDALSETKPSCKPDEFRINKKYEVRRTTCAGCPIGCGAILKSERIGGERDRPEYETVAGFGPMCLNNNMTSIIEANDICNRAGIDTISASTSIAFAIECYQQGIITKQDTDGIELTWGNAAAHITMLEKMIRREGFGAILADGVKRAAEEIGHEAQEYAIHVGGQELGFHDSRQLPARGTSYICDPTPGRHTTFFAGTILEREGSPGPYPELWEPQIELRDYERKSAIYSAAIKYEQVLASAGVCKFVMFQGTFPLIDFISAVTGWDFTPEEALVTGERIQTMRQLFNLREGIDPKKFCLPQRVSKPATTGPHKDIPIDFDMLRKQYYTAIGWNPETGYPIKSRIDELGLGNLVNSARGT